MQSVNEALLMNGCHNKQPACMKKRANQRKARRTICLPTHHVSGAAGSLSEQAKRSGERNNIVEEETNLSSPESFLG